MPPRLRRVEQGIKDNVLTVRAGLPGIDPDKDVEISLTEGQLQIRGRTQGEDRTEG